MNIYKGKNLLLIFSLFFNLNLFFINFDNTSFAVENNVNNKELVCIYSDSSMPTTGLGDMTRQPTGNLFIDIPVLAFDIYETIADTIHNHYYRCSFTNDPQNNQSYDFIKAIQNKDIQYIVFFNGAFSNYFKLYSSKYVKETTLWPKTTIDYIGIIDSNYNILKLNSVKSGQLYEMKTEDWKKIKKYTFEK